MDRLKGKQTWTKKLSTRLSVSLPSNPVQAERAYEILRDMLAQRYGYFVTAMHYDDKKGNNHAHVYLQNIEQMHFRMLSDTQKFSDEFQKRLKAEGILYTFRQGVRPSRTVAEVHMREKGIELWKDNIRKVIHRALISANSYGDFVSYLEKHGITISR